MKKITIDNLKVVYKNRKKESVTALDGFSTVFDADSFNVVVGYSGCGKTTLLKAIAGLVEYEGDIFFDSVELSDLTIKERNIAMVSQNYSLYPRMNIFDNIAFPLTLAGADKKEIIERVYEVSDYLGIRHCLTRKPKHLSGGQQQKVALARALVKKPQLYLFDEPLSNFDAQKRHEARMIIKRAVKDYSASAIYVTHDFKEAMALADKIIVIGDGKVVESGSPQEVFESKNEVVMSLKGRVEDD